MVDAVGNVSGSSNKNTSSITSIKDLENNPEFFPLWVAEIQRQNLNMLFSSASSSSLLTGEDSGTSALDSYYGAGGSTEADIFSALGMGSGTNNSLSSLFSTQGITSDFSFLAPTISLQSMQVEETLRGLQAYTNATENQKWIGQLVEYLDPADGLLKTGRVTKVDIENVALPTFRIDDNVTITIDDIKALGADVSTEMADAGAASGQSA